jgi:hypothetical protein
MHSSCKGRKFSSSMLCLQEFRNRSRDVAAERDGLVEQLKKHSELMKKIDLQAQRLKKELKMLGAFTDAYMSCHLPCSCHVCMCMPSDERNSRALSPMKIQNHKNLLTSTLRSPFLSFPLSLAPIFARFSQVKELPMQLHAYHAFASHTVCAWSCLASLMFLDGDSSL